jgi:hypothetical protein
MIASLILDTCHHISHIWWNTENSDESTFNLYVLLLSGWDYLIKYPKYSTVVEQGEWDKFSQEKLSKVQSRKKKFYECGK